MRKSLYFIFFLIFSLVSTDISYAHTTGTSFEKIVDGHVIDIGYDPATPAAGDRFVLDLSIRDEKTRELQHFRDAWVRVTLGDELLAATGVAESALGPTTFLLKIPEDAGGDMSISVRFEDAEKAIAETQFTVPVVPQKSNSWLMIAILAAVLGCVVGLLVGHLKVLSFVYERIPKIPE